MKKHLLICLVALLAAIGVNAQGTFKVSDYCQKNGIVYTSTTDAAGKVTNTAVVFPKGAVISDVPNITFTASGATDWILTGDYTTNTVNTTFNGIDYPQIGQAQGASNGKDGFIDGGNISSVAIFKPEKDGKLDIAFKFGYNKKFYVAELTDKALDEIDLADSAQVHPFAYNNSQYWGGYWNADNGQYYYGTAVDGTSATKSYFTGCTLDVVAGKSYYVWASGSKIMLMGFNYVVTEVVPPTPKDSTATVTFVVDDSANKTGLDFKLRGSWLTATGVWDTGWDGGADHTSLYDDATHGDATAGDHVWSVAVDLVANASVIWKWGFMIDGKWGPSAPDPEFTVADSTNKIVTYVIPKKVGVNNLNSSAIVVKTEYFNMLGIKLSEPINGINIIRNTMSNGSIVIRKTFIRK
jgi:hypothetical protein